MRTTGSPLDRRRRFWLTLLALLAASALTLIAWLGFLLASFDLNDYRNELEQRGEQLLKMPVAIGEIEYRLHGHSLSLYGRNLQLGDVTSVMQVVIPEIWLDLRWSRLLHRELVISHLTLREPAIRYAIGKMKSTFATPQPARARLQTLLDNLSVKQIELIDGNIELVQNETGSTKTHRLDSLQGSFSNPGQQQPALDLQGEVLMAGQQKPARFALHTKLSARQAAAARVPLSAAELRINSIDIETLLSSLPTGSSRPGFSGQADLLLSLEVRPDEGLSFRCSVTGREMQAGSPDSPGVQVPVARLEARGVWHRRDDRHRLADLSLEIDDSRLRGTVHWQTGPAANGRILLEEAQLPVAAIVSWLPASARSRLPDIDSEQGLLLLDQGEATYVPAADHEEPGTWQVESLQGSLQKLRGLLANGRPVGIDTLKFIFADKRLSLENAEATIDRLRLSCQGEIDLRTAHPGRVQLDVRGRLPAEMATEYWQSLVDQGRFEGDTLLRGTLAGSLDALKFDLNADMAEVGLTVPDLLQLDGAQGDHLQMHGSLADGQLALDHAALHWATIQGQARGRFSLRSPETFDLDAQLRLADLSTLGRIVPRLESLALQGLAELTLRQSGPLNDNLPDMTLELRDVGFKTGGLVADLSQLSGRFEISTDGLQTNRLRAMIGESPFTADLTLTDFSAPRIEASVEASSIRADELIFFSDRRRLRNIKGRLLYGDNRLKLDPVTLSLDNGTNPEIYGTIVIGKPAQVELDIHADYADIGEIVSLWTDRSPDARREKHRKAQASDSIPPQITILASVEQGDLYGMRFQKATGTITPRPQQLIIHPLDFRVDNGYCNAQVLVDRQPDNRTLLRISGHAEDIDALTVYRELLNQTNIVRGRLRGDFYLQGLAGTDYLKTSYGEFQVDINDGVLHKFKTLSKVFSLLNVAQLFSFQLPDMDSQGMPFTRLSGHFSLTAGVLASEDLTIRSNAMNQSLQGSFNLIGHELDLIMAVQPLGTVDKIVSRLPVAGWLLTGEDKALLTAHFKIDGPVEDVHVTPVPVTSLSEKTVGLIRRTLGLPLKLIDDPEILWGGDDDRKKEGSAE